MKFLHWMNPQQSAIKPRVAPRFLNNDSFEVLAASKSLDQSLEPGASIRRRFKRLMDVSAASLGILLLLPLMILIAAAIKLSSPGPALFAQERVGLKGKLFTFLKFRTMFDGCEERVHRNYVIGLIRGECGAIGRASVQKPMSKLDQDERITAIGRFLRTWSLDEIPQLINVLKGEMSLVGPRPAIPYEVENYRAWHKRRLDALPGITGLWQVNGRNTVTFDEMVRMDISYIEQWSPWLDVRILFQTFYAVVCRHGAA